MEPGYHGRTNRIEGERRWRADWEDLRYLPEELLDLGDGRIVVLGRIQGTGASSGAPFDSEWALVIALSAGHVREERVFMDRRAALDAAGLPSDPA
jgi:ketosteroid isomerase-like protein